MKCVICARDIPVRGDWKTGCNAEPVVNGRCCYDCEAEVVIPARIERMGMQQTADATEMLRRAMIKTGHPERAAAAADRKLTTDELRAEYEVLGFCAPIVIVRRKSDGVKGSMEFTHSPRHYFNFVPDTGD